jgi:RNase H-fold protein (predicted Holliday junction resolvase)
VVGESKQSPGSEVDLSQWEGVIAALEEKRKLALVRLFQEAKLLTCEPNKIVVAFPKGTIDGELASDKERVEEMREALAEHFGRTIEFAVELLTDSELAKAGPTAFSLVELTQAARAEEREAREHEAREHPMTKLVLDTFGAAIKEIKTDV